MKVDIANGQIVIDPEITKLKNDQKLQLGFWRFKRNDDVLVSSDIEVLGKTLAYLDDEKLSFSLSDSAKVYLREKSDAHEVHTGLVSAAMDFKEGKFGKEDFRDFSN